MIVLFVLPVGVIWNIIISRVYVNPSSGGFSVNYIKKVEWASLSRLHLAYFIFSLTMIIIFSKITLCGLFVMKTRMKKAETSITVATMVISVEFSLLAMFQIYFAFFSSTTSSWRPFLLRALDFTYDFLNLSTTIIFIAFNQQLRNELFQTWTGNNSAEVSRHSSSKITVPLGPSIWKTPSAK
ncbi:hypothetical protein L5515_004147 [Caenorhabditis briggsae]|uniref:Serpentine receptor class gamma n=1 Tax=Caenorhabditis briggsae TaxID=6238 RepID=A0AAE9EMU9_CAEBR|nr:hypothetical protein L5515_004147 [Caenorhabditis briggsae]